MASEGDITHATTRRFFVFNVFGVIAVMRIYPLSLSEFNALQSYEFLRYGNKVEWEKILLTQATPSTPPRAKRRQNSSNLL